jgi:outer membrane biosynthesis protein TonB
MLSHCFAQNETSYDKIKDSNLLIIDWVEYEASFPGGQGPMKRFLEKKYIVPDSLEKAGIKIGGTIIAEFTIEKDGSLSEFEIIKSLNPVLDNEWLRVLKLMPKWRPAIKRGKLIKTKYKLSITIDILED